MSVSLVTRGELELRIDNGSAHTSQKKRRIAVSSGFQPINTLVCSPRATAWRELRRYFEQRYMCRMDLCGVLTVLAQLPEVFDFNEIHPPPDLKTVSPREARRRQNLLIQKGQPAPGPYPG